jgi:8-oxo-dGTP diphosphatase
MPDASQPTRDPEPGPRDLIEVAAGLVFRAGKLLLTQRPFGSHLGGLWEFPGGKREAGETFEECLHRELKEELGIAVEVCELIESLTHEYPGRAVHLRFFHCRWLRYEPQPLGCPAFVWIHREELTRYDFPPADARLLARLRRAPELWDA